MDGDALASLVEKVKQRQAVLSTGDPHQNTVSLLDQAISVDCFSRQPPNLFLPVSHLLNRVAQSA